MKSKLLLLLFISFFLSCSTEDDNGGQNDIAPQLLFSVPVDNTIDLPDGEITIKLTYDQSVTLVSPHQITLNGEVVTNASVSSHVLMVKINLEMGTKYQLIVPSNTIKGENGLFAKQVNLSFETKQNPVVSGLVVKNPSPETVNLYNFLKENYGKKIISGIMANVSWNIEEAEWVYQNTGKYPALNGFDYIHLHYSPANWIDYSKTEVVENWWNNKGIVTAMWHWNVPKSQGSNDYDFNTSGTAFDVAKATQEGTYENGIVKADLEKVANYLLLLKQKNIPVLWRPLHEAGGGWFWWGAKGAEPCKSLWIMMFNYFQEKGLNNLIWVWTAEPNDGDRWYPGDNYVDIIGRDVYKNPTGSGMYSEYLALKNRYSNKIITLSECGNVAEIADQWSAGATWSWFMPWYDPTGHSYASATYWKNAFANDKVISRDQMPNLK